MDLHELYPIRLPERLTDGVIVLDAHTVADAEAHLHGEDEEMRRRFDATEVATLEHARQVMQRWIDARAAGGPNFVYALRGPSRELLGGCELRLLAADRANVSYWISWEHRGRGHAIRALKLLCDAAAGLENLGRLEAHIAPDNLASRKVAEGAGFVETGTVEETAWTGAVSTMALYVRPVVRSAGRARNSLSGTSL
jgi:RimJ/RimL family protein N-acetyltransferase